MNNRQDGACRPHRQHQRRRKTGTRMPENGHQSASWTILCLCLAMGMAVTTSALSQTEADGALCVKAIPMRSENYTMHYSGAAVRNVTRRIIEPLELGLHDDMQMSVTVFDLHGTDYRLITSGDVHLNPGPVASPCQVCSKSVRRNQRGILCDGCDLWHHAKCVDMTVAEYTYLSNSTDYWHATSALCHKCTLPQVHSATNALCHKCTLPQVHTATSALCHKCTLPQVHTATSALCHKCTLP